MNDTRQLRIVHLSDIHFGRSHRFDPPVTPKGDTPKRIGYPTLLEKLCEDLDTGDPECPVAICITGDFATTASFGEFQEADKFILGLAEAQLLGKSRTIGSIFVVPGNHDVKFDSDDVGERWERWTEFYNRLYKTQEIREDPWNLVKVHDRIDDLGAVILCLNSSIYVQKDKPDEDRGNVDPKQLTKVQDSLEVLRKRDGERFGSSIRIALIHHHPVLIPLLAEPGRGYDAVHNSGKLLTILRQFGFHLVLHGHKHLPVTFTDDTQPAFWTTHRPILVVGGGSAGSRGLPEYPNACNTYNDITLKWHPSGRQSRILVRTRGLSVFDTYRTEALPSRWKWMTLREDDKSIYSGQRIPQSQAGRTLGFGALSTDDEQRRIAEYATARGNMPVIAILPSLLPGQAYEARVWIVPHREPQRDIPVRVTWSAGKNFDGIIVKREEDSTFCATFNYWDSMLIQGKLEFSDQKCSYVYIYARIPKAYDSLLPEE